jgi:hypothetical protein
VTSVGPVLLLALGGFLLGGAYSLHSQHKPVLLVVLVAVLGVLAVVGGVVWL